MNISLEQQCCEHMGSKVDLVYLLGREEVILNFKPKDVQLNQAIDLELGPPTQFLLTNIVKHALLPPVFIMPTFI